MSIALVLCRITLIFDIHDLRHDTRVRGYTEHKQGRTESYKIDDVSSKNHGFFEAYEFVNGRINLLKCTEKRCGCSDPLRRVDRNHNEVILPPCPIRRLACLRTFGLKDNTCSCLPSCQKIITKLILEPGPFNMVQSSLDPIYEGINVTQGAVLRLRININSSKLFLLIPTETWLTLLSSLGGVFNMFLGVGLFSALEIIFLFCVKLPIALRRSTEMIPPTASKLDPIDSIDVE